MFFQIGNYALDVDVEQTRGMIASWLEISQLNCCQGCENYSVAVKNLPESVTTFFSSLGHDISKPTQVFGSYRNDRFYYYHGFYHAIGRIVSQKEEPSIKDYDDDMFTFKPNMSVKLINDFSVSFQSRCESIDPRFLPKPLFQIDISAKLPWCLDYAYFDYSAPTTAEIHDEHGKLIDKKQELNNNEPSYIMVFQIDRSDKIINLCVGEGLFCRHEIGWNGTIMFWSNRMISLKDEK